jgi:hypothetical protein
MDVARLSLGTDLVGRSAGGVVYAKLYLEVDGLSFPHPNWTDFAVVVLSWWCKGAASLLEKATSVDIRFMEGPFLVRIRVVDSNVWEVSLIESSLKRRIHYVAAVNPACLLDSIVAASEQAILLCENNGWWSKDTDDLQNSLAYLRAAMKHLPTT